MNIRLEEIVKEQITSNISSDYGEKKARLDEKVNSMRQEGYTTSEIDNDRIVKKLRGELEVMGDAEEMQAEVFSHLNTFFSRYYDKGDFVTLRRYKKDFRRMIKTTPSGFRLQTSDFRLHFCVTILTAYNITVFENDFFALQFDSITVLKSKIAHNNSGFCGFNSWQVKQGLFPCFH